MYSVASSILALGYFFRISSPTIFLFSYPTIWFQNFHPFWISTGFTRVLFGRGAVPVATFEFPFSAFPVINVMDLSHFLSSTFRSAGVRIFAILIFISPFSYRKFPSHFRLRQKFSIFVILFSIPTARRHFSVLC